MSDAARRSRALLASIVAGAGMAALVQQGCLERHDDGASRSPDDRCTSCHGDSRRAGDAVIRSAPPRDLLGATDPEFPGVGAHDVHLQASATHAAVACTECHVVPDAVDSPGHADDALPAEVIFGELARTPGPAPAYDPVSRTCADTHCHGSAGARAVWSAPRDSEAACGSCHGLPPPRPHPQSERCHVCHGTVIDEQRRFVAPELHVNGIVEEAAGDCSLCHGDAGEAAPPLDTRGNREVTAIGVGAHSAHLAGGRWSRPLACAECHREPDPADVSAHIGRLPAEVFLTGVARSHGHDPAWDREYRTCVDSWCHGPAQRLPTSAIWTEAGPLECTSCHAMPPPAPHPLSNQCSSCHAGVVDADGTIVDRDRHVDGAVDVEVSEACTSCHGAENPAPPRDALGNADTAVPGVGAHQTHVLGTQRSRAVPCGECHVVPETVLDAGHIDSDAPAEVVFSGAAIAFGAAASYDGARCTNTSCHGGAFPDAHASGATNAAPLWTRVDGTEAACGACHGLPPPAPHPKVELNPTCSACHENIRSDNRTFGRPDLHVDGVVTFTLP